MIHDYNFLLQIILKSSYGIDSRLFQDLMQQTSFCQRAAQCSINREAILQEIKRSLISLICTYTTVIINNILKPSLVQRHI